MNKMITGALAGTAGIALLAGGFSTYATWSDDADINAGEIQTGTLEVSTDGDRKWDDVNDQTSDNDWDIDDDKMVPGDHVRLTQPLQINAVGKNFHGVKVTVGGWAHNNFNIDDFDVAGTYNGVPFEVTGPNSAEITFYEDDLDSLKNSVAVLDFEMKSEGDQGSKNATVNLNAITVNVEQLTGS